MGLVSVRGIDVGNIDGHVVVQDWGAPGRATYIPSHVRTANRHVMQALQVEREVQWTVCDVQGHVACCVSVEVQRCVEVQNRNWNALCDVLDGRVGLQIPLVCVIH